MKATNLRFFNDRAQINPANIYITNIKLYESSKVNETSKEYYYVRNAQGDIIGLADEYGNDVVSYLYDSYGKLISITRKMAGSVGVVNPYRYRGYRYDSETGLYYLQSRYYNPEWGRFINADAIAGSIGELLSHNVFAYCKNNPVNRQDPSGFRSIRNDFTDPDEIDYETSSSSLSSSTGTSKTNSKSTVDFDTKGMIRDATITAVQNAPINVIIPYFGNIPMKTSMAELETFGNGFLGIGIVTTLMSVNDNASYRQIKGSIFNIIDLGA